jgi:hypothetical protein
MGRHHMDRPPSRPSHSVRFKCPNSCCDKGAAAWTGPPGGAREGGDGGQVAEVRVVTAFDHKRFGNAPVANLMDGRSGGARLRAGPRWWGMVRRRPRPQPQLFLVRMWYEPLGDGRGEWRGVVQVGEERAYFRTWDRLVAILRAHLALAEREARPVDGTSP